MSNTQRPTLAKKVTRQSETARNEALDEGLKLTIDGVTYEARIGDVTATLARELRAKTGNGFMHLIRETAADPDIDLISTFVWVARRIAGEDVEFDDVQVTYAQMLSDDFDVALPGAEDVDDSPET